MKFWFWVNYPFNIQRVNICTCRRGKPLYIHLFMPHQDCKRWWCFHSDHLGCSHRNWVVRFVKQCSIISQGGPLCLAVGRLSRAVNQDWAIIPEWHRVMEAPCHDSVVKGELWLCECVREFCLSGRSNNTLKRSVALKYSGLTSIMSEVAHRTEEAAMVAVTFVWLSYIYFDLFWSRE